MTPSITHLLNFSFLGGKVYVCVLIKEKGRFFKKIGGIPDALVKIL
jgi:hypothetical protein